MSVFIDQDISLNKYHYVFYSYSKENPNSLKAQFYDSNQTIVGSHDISFSQLDVPAMLNFLENSESNPYAIGKTPSSFRNMDVAFSAIYKKPLQDSQQQSLMTYVNKKFKNVYSNAVTVYTITVANNGTSNVYYINGEEKPDIQLTQNGLYVFDQSDITNETHPLRFQLHSNSTPYTIGVTIERTQGKPNAYVMIEITDDTPILNYYCTNHSGMGNVFSKGITYTNELILSSEEQKIGNGGTATSILTASSWDGRFPASNFISTMSNYFWHTGFTNQLGVTYSTNGNGAWSQTAYGVNAYTSSSFRGPNITYMCNGSLYPDNLISNVTLADGSSPTSLVTRYSDATTYNTTTESGLNGEWVSFDHSQTPFVASEIGWISNALDRNFKTWYFIGSNDNLNWTEIDSRINDTTITTTSLTFTLPLSTTSYKYHTLVITQLNGSSNPVINAYNFYIKGKTVTTNQIEYDGPLTKFQVSVSGESFYIDNIKNSILDLQPGNIYRFSQNDDSNANYPIKFSTTLDGTHNGGTEYTTGIYTTGTPGNFNAHTVIDFSNNPYVDLYYYSDTSSNMGGLAFTPPTYTVKTDTNVLGDTVFSIQKPGESVFYAQPDLSFGAGFIGLFNVAQITGSYTMVFGTEVDVSNTVQTQYFSQNGDVIVLSIPSDYSGDSLKYFENTTAGMGYAVFNGNTEINVVPIILWYNFDTTTVNGNNITNVADGSSLGDAVMTRSSIVTDVTKTGTGSLLCVRDSGPSQYVTLPSLTLPSEFTICFWHKMTPDDNFATNIYMLYYLGVNATDSWNSQYAIDIEIKNGGDIQLLLNHSNSGSPYYYNGIYPNDNEWHHLMFIKSTTDFKVYLDNVERTPNTAITSTTMGTFSSSTYNSHYISGRYDVNQVNQYHMGGHTDDYRFYNKVLDSAEREIVYNYAPTILESYTVDVSNGVFRLDNGSGFVESPQLTFTPDTTYIFDQSHASNAGNTLVLGSIPDSSTNLIDSQTVIGTPGQPGAYTSFTASGETVYYYYSFESPFMGYQISYTIVSVSKDSFYPGETTTIRVKNTTPYDGAYTITLTDINQSDLNNADLSGSIPKQAITDFTYSIPSDVTNVGSFTYSIDGTDISATIQITEAPPIYRYTVEVSGGVYWLQLNDYIGPMGLKQAQPALPQFELGTQYEFHYTDSNHPIRLSTTIDGTHGSGGVEYTTGVTKEEDSTDVNVTPYKLILVAEENVTLHYYCSAHSGYGDTGTSASYATYNDVLGIHFTFDDYIDLDAEFATVNSVTLNNKGTFGTAGNGTIHKGATQSLSFSSTEKKVGNYSLYNSNNTQKGGYLSYIGLSGTIGYDNGLSGSNTGFTFMAWAYEEPGTNNYTLWMAHHGLGYKCGFILNNIICGNQTAVKSTDPLRAANVNSWHHFAFRALPNYTNYNGMDLALVEVYYDGVKRSGWTPLDWREREFPLQLQGFRLVSANANDYGMKGYLDDIRLYNEWLPESEIQRISGFLIPYTLSATTDFVFPNNLTYNVVMDTVYITVTNKNSFDGSYTVTLGGNVLQSDINNASLSGSIPAKATTVYKYMIPSNVEHTGFFVFSIDGTDHSTTVEVLDGPKIGDIYDVEVNSSVYWLQRKDDFGPLGASYQQPLLPEFKFGVRYEFHYTDNHPIRLSTTIDGTHGSDGVEYTTGVTVEESADTGVTPHKLILIAEEDVTLHYYNIAGSSYGDTGTSTTYITFLDNMKIRYTFDISTNLVSGQNANVINGGSAGASGDATLYTNGSATHTISYDADSKVGSYSLYNNTDANGGSSGYLGLPNMSLSNSNGFTYMMWIKPITVGGQSSWISYVTSGQVIYGYSLFYINTSSVLAIGANYSDGLGDFAVKISNDVNSLFNGWHHYAVSGNVVDGNTIVKGYIDGQLTTSVNVSDSTLSVRRNYDYGPITTTNGIRLFASHTAYRALKGYMDDIRFYDEQLPDSEILRVYNETV